MFCKDCEYFFDDGHCCVMEEQRDREHPICVFFCREEDGFVPRFCYLARDINAMAKAMVTTVTFTDPDSGKKHKYFRFREKLYSRKHYAMTDAGCWLLEPNK